MQPHSHNQSIVNCRHILFGMNELSLQQCLQQIEEKLGWGSSADWLNQDFQLLSDRIFEETRVRLSITTLKRVWGKVNYDSVPSISTLNALALFLGYENWSSYRQTVQIKEPAKTKAISRKKISSKVMIAAGVIVLIISTAAVLAFSGKKALTPFTAEELRDVQFSSQPVSLGLPNSVVFKYNFAGLNAEYTAIQQSWNDQLTFEVDPNGQEATGIYYYPGYFRAKLVADGQILREHDIHIRTDGWMATIDEDEKPRYLYSEEIKADGALKLSEATFQEMHDMESDRAPLLTFHYFDESFENIPGDDFTYEARFRNSYHKSNGICQQTQLLIHGQNGVIIMPFSIPGCISDLSVFAIGNSISGKTNDLSAFGTNIEEWQVAKCVVEGDVAHMYLNGQKIREVFVPSYLGELVGFKFRYTGAGELDYVKLSGPDGLVVDEQFD